MISKTSATIFVTTYLFNKMRRHFLRLITLYALATLPGLSGVKLELPKQPQICNSEMCECTTVNFECRLKGKFSLVNVEARIQTWDDRTDLVTVYELNITCVYEPEDLNVVLNMMPPVRLADPTEYYLKNCLEYPALLQQSHATYEGIVEFDQFLETPPRFFNQTPVLQKLTVPVRLIYVKNPLPPQLFHNLTNLQHLKLKIYTAYPEVRYPLELLHTLYNLETLSIELIALQTSVRDIQSEHFRDLRSLKQLNLDANHMMALPGELFTTLPELRRLSLRLNSLEELPRDLLRMQHKLLLLDLSENHLSALPKGIFDNTPLLWELILAQNRFSVPTSIIENVHALSYLRKIDLGYNGLETIWGTDIYRNHTLFTRARITDVQALTNFKQMAMYVAGLREVEPLNYTEVILRANQLTYFSLDWIAAAGISCPYYIDLARNNIRHVHALLSPTKATCLQEVHLVHNPLACDCELAWIYNTNLLVIGVKWQCATPERLYGSDLQNLRSDALCEWSPAWCPLKCRCTRHMNALLIDCSAAALQALSQLPRPEQLSLAETTLNLTHNHFRELPPNTTFGYANVTRLYAAHNRLNMLLSIHLPPALRILDLRTNQLERLGENFLRAYLNDSATLTALYLSDNPWLCDCATELFLYTLRVHRSRIPDIEELFCANLPNITLANATFTDICMLPSSSWALMTQLSATFLTILTLLTCITLYYKYELELKIWLHAHNVNIACCCIDEIDCNKTFDAFISYAHEQSDYVNQVLVPGLEKTAPYFRICTHERNWLAGAYIPEQIVESVAQSRRTIIVLSQDFIASLWARMEFKTAHQFAVNERRARIIIIKYGEIGDMTGLDSELQAYLRMNTYLESEDLRFWQKLRYAMPHRRGEGRKAGMLEVGERVYVRGQVELNQMAINK
nr:protein toll-like isoform X1 [Bactrocera oleae]XP_036226996.1 protein toll-like isoform X1 [Bactrocera oleae]